jgi:hypothetical protein
MSELQKHVTFERKYGANLDAAFPERSRPANRARWCRSMAKDFGVSQATVKAAFRGVWL